MTHSELRGLQQGDSVRWYDPDSDEIDVCVVQEILTQSGYLYNMDDVLIISGSDGHAIEVYASELA